MKNALLLLLALLFSFEKLLAQPPHTEISKKQYFTQVAADNSIEFDGIPDEAAWDKVDWSGDFVEYQPHENTPPSQPSQFKIL